MKNNIEINFEIVIKMSVDIEILVWAVYYQNKMLDKPLNKISKSSTLRFLKDQMKQFGDRHESLIGGCSDDITDELKELYLTRIEKIFNRR